MHNMPFIVAVMSSSDADMTQMVRIVCICYSLHVASSRAIAIAIAIASSEFVACNRAIDQFDRVDIIFNILCLGVNGNEEEECR